MKDFLGFVDTVDTQLFNFVIVDGKHYVSTDKDELLQLVGQLCKHTPKLLSKQCTILCSKISVPKVPKVQNSRKLF